MMLVDKNIKKLAKNGILISEGFDVENVNSISYDLTVGEIVNCSEQETDLIPGETVFIKTKEELNLPNCITGRIGDKNSLLRLGLKVDGPQYQPEHRTYAFLRIQNVSSCVIKIKCGMKIAQIYFEELKEIPEHTYAQQKNASFLNENVYRGYGNYREEYNQNIKSFQSVKEDIESASNRIYGNVLTLMGIIVAIFSMLTINYQAFVNADLGPKYIIAMNLSLTFCILVMLGTIMLIINKQKNQKFSDFYVILLICLGIATMVFCLI